MTIIKTITLVLTGSALGLAASWAMPSTTQAEDAKLAGWAQVADGYADGFKLYRTQLANGDVCYTNGSALNCNIAR